MKKVSRGRVTPKKFREQSAALLVVGDGVGPWLICEPASGAAWSWCSLCGSVMQLDFDAAPWEQLCSECQRSSLRGRGVQAGEGSPSAAARRDPLRRGVGA